MNGNDMVINFDQVPRQNIQYQLSNTKINGHLVAVTIIVSPFVPSFIHLDFLTMFVVLRPLDDSNFFSDM